MLAAYVAVVALMGRYINRWIMETVRLRLDQAAANSKLQAAVAESKAVLNEIEQIYRYSPVGLCFMDTNYRFVRINEHMAEINGLPVSAHIGHTLREVIPAACRRDHGTLPAGLRARRAGPERGDSGTTPAAPGVQRHWLANFFPFRSETGEVTGLIGAVMDITDLKQTQLALRQSEERFRTIFNSVNDLIFVHDFETGSFVDVNHSACEMLGYTRDELLKLKIGDLSENKPPYTRQNLLSGDAEGAIRDAANVRLARQDKGWAVVLGRTLASPGHLRRTGFAAHDRPRNFATQGGGRSAQEDGAVRPSHRIGQSRRIRRRGSPGDRARAPRRAQASRCFISISIISRTSTIRWDTRSEIGCSSPSPSGCRRM